MISEDQVRIFHERGWLVVEGVYLPEEADEVARIALETADSMDVEESMEGYLLDRSESGGARPLRERSTIRIYATRCSGTSLSTTGFETFSVNSPAKTPCSRAISSS